MLNTDGDPELEREEIELLLQRQVDDVLYASMYYRGVEVPEQLRSVPTVAGSAGSGANKGEEVGCGAWYLPMRVRSARAHTTARGQYRIHPAMPELVENALLKLPRP